MSERKVIIGSTYYATPGDGMEWFYPLWLHNTLPAGVPIFMVGTGAWVAKEFPGVQWVRLTGKLGHCDEILNGSKAHFMPACPAGWMALAWMAYINECDFIYKEQDCLAFGPWMNRLYAELGDGRAIFGKGRMFGAATSLFLVRHEFIPRFVRDYLAEGVENVMNRLPERKIARLVDRDPERYRQYSFGYDKDRPFNLNDEVFYLQKITREELRQLQDAKLLPFYDRQPDVAIFSNRNRA